MARFKRKFKNGDKVEIISNTYGCGELISTKGVIGEVVGVTKHWYEESILYKVKLYNFNGIEKVTYNARGLGRVADMRANKMKLINSIAVELL